jgi:hypothetical protein
MARLPGWNWLRIAIMDLRRFAESVHDASPASRFHDHRLRRILPDIRHNPAQTTII